VTDLLVRGGANAYSHHLIDTAANQGMLRTLRMLGKATSQMLKRFDHDVEEA